MATNPGRVCVTAVDSNTADSNTTDTTTVTGGSKPLHRFLKGEPKCVGVVLMFLGLSLVLFGIPLKTDTVETSADLYSSFWLGILYFVTGLLYLLSEREPTKKIVTASFAFSIISILGTVVAALQFIKGLVNLSYASVYELYGHDYMHANFTLLESVTTHHYMSLYSLEAVFLFHSMVAVVILITMAVFARLGLRSSRTQMVVVMRNLPSTE